MDDAKQRRALLVLLVVLMLLPSVAAWMYFIALAGSGWVQWIYGGSKVVQFGMPLVWMWWVERRLPRPHRPHWPDVQLGLTWGAALVLLGLAAYFGYFRGSPYLESTPELIRQKLADMGIDTPALFFAFAGFLAIHALLEEYYWRWFIHGRLRQFIPWQASLLISSLAFMAHHVIIVERYLYAPAWLLALFSLCVAFGGGVWAWLYQRTGSLYASWASHVLLDFGVMFIGFDLVWRMG